MSKHLHNHFLRLKFCGIKNNTSFFFYSKEHEPVHIHVEGNDGMAKFDWDGDKFVLVEKQNIKAGDMKKIKTVINDNADIIIKRWKEHFEQ